jgi:peptidoglycan-associated lipoprotein
MIKHSVSRVSPTLSFICAVSLIACGRSPNTKSLSAAEEAPRPTLPPAVTDSDSTRGARSRGAVLTTRISFRFDDAALSSEARATLAAKATALRASPDLRLRVEGHADERGSDEYNLALGMRRAVSAKRYLMQLGVDAQRMEAVSYGEERPLDRGHSEIAWSKNRRAEFEIVAASMNSGR